MRCAEKHHRLVWFGVSIPLIFASLIVLMLRPSFLIGQTPVDTPALRTFNIAANPQFSNYKNVVTAYALKHRPTSTNDFCIVGYLTDDDLKNSFVIWQQGQKMILWYGGDQQLDASQRILDLRTDVVPTENDLHGSTYLVTQAWVEQMVTTCKRVGISVRVPAKRTPNRQ